MKSSRVLRRDRSWMSGFRSRRSDKLIHQNQVRNLIYSASAAHRGWRCSFGLLALALAGAGLYGVLAYTVTQRTQEIGLRIALGAQRRDVLLLIVRHALKLTLPGVVLGVPASYGLTKLMKSYLYGVSLTDPLTIIVISAMLISVALIAGFVPGRRATLVDPIMALRHE
jgi:putative ABC transport system permease protein